jgi:hypothetical protein
VESLKAVELDPERLRILVTVISSSSNERTIGMERLVGYSESKPGAFSSTESSEKETFFLRRVPTLELEPVEELLRDVWLALELSKLADMADLGRRSGDTKSSEALECLL